MRVLATLVQDLLDVIGRPYDGVDHVVMNDVHETILDPGKSDHALAAMGVVAQTSCDVVANLNLHCRLAEINVAGVMQFKAHHVLRHAHEPLPHRNEKLRRLEAVLEVAEDGKRYPPVGPREIAAAAHSIQNDTF
jgi:hypothetical protein